MARRKTLRRKTTRRYGKRRTTHRKKSGRKNGPIKRMIKRIIARDVENKTVQQIVNTRALSVPADAIGFDTFNVISLGPAAVSLPITQGTGQGNRVGNTIKTKKLSLKGVIYPLPYNLTTNAIMRPLQVRMWIFYDRANPTEFPAPAVGANFFQNGSSSVGPAGDLTDMYRPVNTDRYRVLEQRTFKLGYANYGGTVPGPDAQFFANNDFSLNQIFSFSLAKHYPKLVKFNDNNADPTTRHLYLLVEVVPAVGGSFVSATQPANIQWIQDYVYEDA